MKQCSFMHNTLIKHKIYLHLLVLNLLKNSTVTHVSNNILDWQLSRCGDFVRKSKTLKNSILKSVVHYDQ